MRPPRMLLSAAARRILSPFVPSRKTLPFTVGLTWLGGEEIPYYWQLDKFCGSTGVAIDIGANLGLYTYSLSKRFKRVYSFEINDEITGYIEKYNPGNIELHHCGLSSSAGTAKLYVPIAHGQALSGWGTLHREILPEEMGKVLAKECPVARLDDFDISDVGFIKIDVEGHELEVLKGAGKTIAQSRPVVLVEVRTIHEKTVDAWFQNLDYQQCRFDERLRLTQVFGAPPSTGDCVFVPRERLSELGIKN